MNSKIRFFYLFALSSFILYSCSRIENDIIPDVYVSFSIDLNDPEFFVLNGAGTFAYVDGSTNNLGYRAAGFKESGIIIYSATQDDFYAFDRTCPHEYSIDQSVIKVNATDTYAICPQCSTKYVMPSFGTPVSGPGRYPLKNYKTRFDGRYIFVWNGY